MAKWEGGVLTAAGRKLLAKVETGAVLKLTKLQVGDGDETKDDIEKLTALKSPRKDIPITNTSADDGVCEVSGILRSADIEEGFYARELGLFAMDPDEGEILYMLCLDLAPDFVPPKSLCSYVTAEYSMYIGVSSTDNFTINIDSDGLATVRQIQKEARCLQRETSYKLGDMLYDTRLRPGFFLKCIQAGTTSADGVTINRLTLNDTIQDGGVVWKVCRMAVSEGDAFKSVKDGFTAGTLDAVDEFAEFIQQNDGSIIPAPRRFSTAKIMRLANGDMIASTVSVQADDDSDDNDDPIEGVELATNEDMDKLAAKFDY